VPGDQTDPPQARVAPFFGDPAAVVALGRIIDAWGVKGWLKVEPFSQASDTTLVRAPHWHLSRSQSSRSQAPALPAIQVEIERARRHGATVVAKCAGIEDREAALALKGAEVGVRRADFPALPDGEYYWLDLIGCALINVQGASLGTVTAMDDHGAHPLLQTDLGVMVPFVDAYLVEVAPPERRIVVDWQADWSR
jgi:16S rRNA processing protein RimM